MDMTPSFRPRILNTDALRVAHNDLQPLHEKGTDKEAAEELQREMIRLRTQDGVVGQIEGSVFQRLAGDETEVRRLVLRENEQDTIEVRAAEKIGVRGLPQNLDHINSVGPAKPLGYLPFNTIEKLSPVGDVIKSLERKGLQTIVVDQAPFPEKFLYVFDERALQQLLDSRMDVLKKTGWPLTARKFVEKVAAEFADAYTELFDLVADAFADTSNPGRTSNIIAKHANS